VALISEPYFYLYSMSWPFFRCVDVGNINCCFKSVFYHIVFYVIIVDRHVLIYVIISIV